jgi:glycosyltransferase involved in cell wall biosynthesis
MLGILIPAYNAEHTLPGVVARIPFDRLGPTLVRVINDGSRDGTARVAASLGDSRISVINLPSNRGYGGAVKRGLASLTAAGAHVVACVHADGQYAPEELPDLLADLQSRGLDLLQGSRIAGGRALAGGMPIYKYLAGQMLTALENQVIAAGFSDYHSGYLIYGPRALALLPFAALSNHFEFDLEVIACAKATGLRVGERPIPTHYGDEISYLDPIRYGLDVLDVLTRFRAGHYHRLAAGGRPGGR